NMSQSSSFRLAYEAREKVLFDEQAKLAHAREVGIEEGMEKGKKVGKEEGIQEGMEKGKLAEREQLIRGMHKNGMDIEDIAKFTNMELSDIRHILEQ
ncbi:Rpn family recombination-promoting nuclease/putative transposase, partial [Bacillus toyonensis]